MSPSTKKSKKVFSRPAHSGSQDSGSPAMAEQWVQSQAVEGPWDNIDYAAGTWPDNMHSSGAYAESLMASQGSVKRSHKHEHHKKSGNKK
ncbi:hypothetical protein G7054_g997 [Neopestalotiopsis clavispora]|nr:hypothetical protein G7054_g997 [Neopestalotiopsis clavispora]